MRAGALLAEFADRGTVASGCIVFDDHAALALIDRAEQEYIAVVGVEQVRREDLTSYRPMSRRGLDDMERVRCWGSARSFVGALCGRGLYFEVALEPAVATHIAKLKYLFRTGQTWSQNSAEEGSSLQ